MKRGSFTCLLMCRLVESKRCRQILGKATSKGMGVIKIKDSDAIRRLDTSGGMVFSVQDANFSSSQVLTKDQVTEMFPDVLDDAVCAPEGEYQIRLNESAKPVQHAPQRGSTRSGCSSDKVKENLDELHASGVIEHCSMTPGRRFRDLLNR